MKSSTKTWLFIGILLVIVLAAGGNLNLQSLTQQQQVTTQVPSGQLFTGTAIAHISHYNALDIVSSLAEGTNVATTWLRNRGGAWQAVASGNNANIAVEAADNGFIYMKIGEVAGQNYYLDRVQTEKASPRIVPGSYQFIDVTGDGVKEHIFKIWVGDLKAPTGGQTGSDFYISAYWYSYEKPAINTPSDISSIGTTPGTAKYIEWYTYFTTSKKAWLVSEIELKINSTATTKWDTSLSYVNVPGKGFFYLNTATKTTDGTNTYYTWTIGKQLNDAYPITYGANELNKKEWTTKLVLNLSAGDKLNVTLTITGLKTTGAAETVTDTVLLSA